MKTKMLGNKTIACARPQWSVAAMIVAMLLTVGTLNATALTKKAAPPTTGKPVAAAKATPLSSAPAMASLAPAANAEDIRDIRPPYHISPGWLWLTWIAGGVVLAALGYGLWRWRHRLPGLRPKLPFELALEKLQAARGLMQPGHAREFSILVSEIVRHYIEARFATRAAHRTTEEFLHDCLAESATPLAEHRPLLGDFLHHCDLAKFARWVLSVPEMETMLQSASNFVRETGAAAQAAEQSPAHSVEDDSPTNPGGMVEVEAPSVVVNSDHAAATSAGKSSTLHSIPS